MPLRGTVDSLSCLHKSRRPTKKCYRERVTDCEVGMTEQRKNIRMPIRMHLEVSDIFKQDNVKVSNINAPIEVIDICRDGIGFVTTSMLPIGFYFNSRLEFKNSNNAINCVIQIIRQNRREDGLNHYGCTFTGMPAVFDYIFEEMEEEFRKNKAEENAQAE